MYNLEEDVIFLLKYYVARESKGEKAFRKYLNDCQLKVCLSIIHNDLTETGGKNKLVIHTKLSQTSDVPKDDNVFETEEQYSFYIKSQNVSHRIKTYSNNDLISVETVVTRSDIDYESVFKTTVSTVAGNREKSHRSFIREKLKCLPHNPDIPPVVMRSPAPSLIEQIPHQENGKIKKRLSFTKKKDHKSKRTSEGGQDMTNSDNRRKSPDPGKLGKIKIPKKSIVDMMKSIIHKNDDSVVPVITHLLNTGRRLSVSNIEQFSTESNEMEKEKPINIITEIYENSKNNKFDIITDDIAFIDEDNIDENENFVHFERQSSVNSNDSYYHFDFESNNVTRSRNCSVQESSSCDCTNRRLSIIYDYIESHLEKKTEGKIITKIPELKDGHLDDCPMFLMHSPASSSPLSFPSPRRRRDSVISNISESRLDPIIEDLKLNNQLNCPVEYVKYFTRCRSYESYEKGLSKVLEPAVTLENLILFFHLTRTVITQIGDPIWKDSSEIDRIMNFSIKYLLVKFYPDIFEHGSIEGFIRHDSDRLLTDID